MYTAIFVFGSNIISFLMQGKNQKIGIIRWLARIISIVFACFISIFALDVFGEGYSFWNTILALLIHLIPTFIVTVIIILSWRWEWIGGISFLTLSIIYAFSKWGEIDVSGFAMIFIPLIALAALFFIGWYQRNKSQV